LQAIPTVQLVIVGEGPERSRLEALRDQLSLADRVKFLGALSHEEALRIIRAADIFLLSSRTEGLSHVLLEAMSFGTPCIAASVGGNVELITDGFNGLLVPFGDVSALQKAICELIESPERRAQIVQAAYASMDRFSWEHLVDKTEALLKEVAHV
jgi:glycosyltransferase involved in cell wall biosynthesis